jgi:hypothetical protein
MGFALTSLSRATKLAQARSAGLMPCQAVIAAQSRERHAHNGFGSFGDVLQPIKVMTIELPVISPIAHQIEKLTRNTKRSPTTDKASINLSECVVTL